MIFNIDYISSPKVFEIKMMLNNMVSMQQEVESNTQIEGKANLKTKLGFNIMDIFKLGDVETGGNIKGSKGK